MSILGAKPARNRYLGNSSRKPQTPVTNELIGYKKVVLLYDGKHISFESPTYNVPYGVTATAECQKHTYRYDQSEHALKDCTCGFYSFHDETDALTYPNDRITRLLRRLLKKRSGNMSEESFADLVQAHPILGSLIDPSTTVQQLAVILGWDVGHPQVVIETVSSGQYVEYKKGYRSQKQRVKTIIVNDCNLCAKDLIVSPSVAFIKDDEDLRPVCQTHALEAKTRHRYTFEEVAAMVSYPKDYKHPKVSIRSSDPDAVAANREDLKTTAAWAPFVALSRSFFRD